MLFRSRWGALLASMMLLPGSALALEGDPVPLDRSLLALPLLTIDEEAGLECIASAPEDRAPSCPPVVLDAESIQPAEAGTAKFTDAFTYSDLWTVMPGFLFLGGGGGGGGGGTPTGGPSGPSASTTPLCDGDCGPAPMETSAPWDDQPTWDVPRHTDPVPEPATVVLFLAGSALVGRAVHRKL